ncbi:Ketosteroid isomerase homolog [Pedobacter antarcticus]|uniref:Ketosteroid isomerase homolog n=1 Tax=Pedobacter antarcticus TaxID=34086 RepID=A0A1I2EFU4_9SPHI|nr:Ketosteroid isomerase homolog [Pedobacter antarcticus]
MAKIKRFQGLNLGRGVKLIYIYNMEQTSKDVLDIFAARAASNAAIAAADAKAVAAFWMDDIHVQSGEGGQYKGKKELEQIFFSMFKKDPPLFARNPEEVILGESGILAWEKGNWSYQTAPFRGFYAAMWRKIGNRWLIQSELFVSLD